MHLFTNNKNSYFRIENWECYISTPTLDARIQPHNVRTSFIKLTMKSWKHVLKNGLLSFSFNLIKVQVHSISISIRRVIAFNQTINLETMLLVQIQCRGSQRIHVKHYTRNFSCSAFLNCRFQKNLSMSMPPPLLFHYNKTKTSHFKGSIQAFFISKVNN